MRILTEPDASLTPSSTPVSLKTEDVSLEFSADGIDRIAEWPGRSMAYRNIGARRLHTVMERLLESISFEAADRSGQSVLVDRAYVDAHLSNLAEDEDLSCFPSVDRLFGQSYTGSSNLGEDADGPLLLIDGLNLIRRVHAGVPPDASDHHEAVINACAASARRRHCEEHRPTHVILVMEDFRRKLASERISNYKKIGHMPADLARNLPAIQRPSPPSLASRP